ncbi:MAG: hypothetical protein HY896_05535 [Deltaproteobacteria bacterium]|nr:hypothetical protein [Deltaproteobacteria bacterium]
MKRIAAIGFILVFGLVSESWAVNLKATPSITIGESWDSNVLNTSSNEQSDFVFRANPKLTLSLETMDTTLNLSGGFELERYSDFTLLDKTAATKDLGLNTTKPIKFTPRFSLRPTARYIEARDSVRRNVLELIPTVITPGSSGYGIESTSSEPARSEGPADTGITVLSVSESTVTFITEVREISGSAQFGYELTPNVNVEIGGGARRRDFTDNPTGLIDSRVVSGNMAVNYKLTDRFSSGVYGDTSYNSFSGRPNSRIYSGGFSGTYRLTESNTLDARAGATLSRESTGIGDEKNETWSPSGLLSLTYSRKDFRALVSGKYELAGGGTFGRTTRRANAVLSLADQFASGWWLDLSGFCQTNRSTDAAVEVDLVSANGTAGIRYMPAKWATLSLYGNFFRQWSHGISGDDLKRESVLLAVTLGETYNLF